MDKTKIKTFEIAFGIVEDLIKLVEFETKEQVLEVANKALIMSRNDNSLDETTKNAYESAYKKLQLMSFDDMRAFKEALLD